jgi:Secretion system C-terminal sorting domain
MKNSILFAIVLLTSFSMCINAQVKQVNYSILNQELNDMVFDSAISRILISIPGTDAIHGNSIGIVVPDSNIMTNYCFIGSEPNKMAITDNSKYLYVGMDGSATIKQFNLNTLKTVQTISLGGSNFDGPNFANSISCMPNVDSIIAVAKISGSYSRGASIYNNGVQLRDTIREYPTAIDVLHFYNANILYGYNNEDTGFDFSTMTVDSNGVHYVGSVGSMMSGFETDFYIYGTIAVSDNGIALDLSCSTPSLFGMFNISNDYGGSIVKCCIDPYLNLACFAQKGFWTDSVYIERFHLNTLLKYDQINIGVINDDVSKIINWGDSTKLAISTRSGQLIIINGIKTSLGINQNQTPIPNLVVYPNPVENKLFIETSKSNKNEILIICDINGQELIRQQIIDTRIQIDFRNFTSGIYFVKLISGDTIEVRKVIKI